MRGKHLYLWAFLLSIGAITYHDIKDCHQLPWPPRFIMTGLVFGVLEITSLLSEEIAGVTAIGFVIAIFLNKGFVGDCNIQNANSTGQVQTTAFTNANFATDQPASVAYSYQIPTGNSPNVAPAQAPPSGQFNPVTGGKPPGALA